MIAHSFPFDPTYGYDRAALLAIAPPPAPADFDDFWRATFDQTMSTPLRIEVRPSKATVPNRAVREVYFDTLHGRRVGSWLVTPTDGKVRRGVVAGHGYGGRASPDGDLAMKETAFLLPSAPGFHVSAAPGIPDTPARHVIHGIGSRETYILRDCVASLWSAVSVIHELVPEVEGVLNFEGGSFGGGLGALMLPWDRRIRAAHLSVPTFGHHPIRLNCRCNGSGEAVRLLHQRNPEIADVLRYFDAATAATRVNIPVIVSPALFDPAVPPPGQFAVANALGGEKKVFTLTAGHFEYAEMAREHGELREAVRAWFA